MIALNINDSKFKSSLFRKSITQENSFNLKCSLSRHAKKRLQQRGIRSWVVDFILDNADICKGVGAGGVSQFISRSKIKKLIRDKVLSPSDEAAVKGVVVIDKGDQVTTVFHKQIRLRS